MRTTLNLNEEALSQCLLNISQLELAILIGSQVNGKTHSESDWDIAIRWHRQPKINVMTALAQTETLRQTLAQLLNVTDDKIDLIDLTNARLTMRVVVAEDGVVKGRRHWHGIIFYNVPGVS